MYSGVPTNCSALLRFFPATNYCQLNYIKSCAVQQMRDAKLLKSPFNVTEVAQIIPTQKKIKDFKKKKKKKRKEHTGIGKILR